VYTKLGTCLFAAQGVISVLLFVHFFLPGARGPGPKIRETRSSRPPINTRIAMLGLARWGWVLHDTYFVYTKVGAYRITRVGALRLLLFFFFF
jgi:hypothetical protein